MEGECEVRTVEIVIIKPKTELWLQLKENYIKWVALRKINPKLYYSP